MSGREEVAVPMHFGRTGLDSRIFQAQVECNFRLWIDEQGHRLRLKLIQSL
jgi:hypothetical protein